MTDTSSLARKSGHPGHNRLVRLRPLADAAGANYNTEAKVARAGESLGYAERKDRVDQKTAVIPYHK